MAGLDVMRREGYALASHDERRRSAGAAGQAERGDPGLPAPGRGDRVVLVGVPEAAVVDRVDVHGGVVAPAGRRVGLGARALHDRAFALGHLVGHVVAEPARVADAGIGGLAGHAVAEGHVAPLVLGDAAHPAVQVVGRGVGALLVDERLVAGAAQLVPAHAGDARPGLDRLAGYERLVCAEV